VLQELNRLSANPETLEVWERKVRCQAKALDAHRVPDLVDVHDQARSDLNLANRLYFRQVEIERVRLNIKSPVHGPLLSHSTQ
jgi:hypothetical protein